MVVLEVFWLRGLLKEIKFDLQHPTSLCCENKKTIQIAKNHTFHKRTKHIKIDCHFIREKLMEKVICTKSVACKDQL